MKTSIVKKKNAGARRCVICSKPRADRLYRDRPVKLFVHSKCLPDSAPGNFSDFATKVQTGEIC